MRKRQTMEQDTHEGTVRRTNTIENSTRKMDDGKRIPGTINRRKWKHQLLTRRPEQIRLRIRTRTR